MKIIDAQVHLWSSGMPSLPHRQITAFGAEELLRDMDEAGVDAALIHPPISWDPQANAQAEEAARRWPTRFAVLGQVPLDSPDSSALLPGWRDRPGMMGLRYPLLKPEQQEWHRDGTMDWLWRDAERLGLPVATMAGRFLRDFGQIAERHPRLRLIVDHLGLVRTGRDQAAFDLLQAMNTGHDGSMTTLHANTPRDAIARTETMCLMSGMDLPLRAIREQIASAVNLIVQQARLKDGSRKITNITEVQGMEQDTVVLQDIYRFVQDGVGEDGKAHGYFEATGVRPSFMPRLESAGIRLPASAFRQRIMMRA